MKRTSVEHRAYYSAGLDDIDRYIREHHQPQNTFIGSQSNGPTDIMDPITIHPYFPEGIQLSGNLFLPNTFDVLQLLSYFAAGWAAILLTTSVIVKKINPALSKGDQALIWWFVLCK